MGRHSSSSQLSFYRSIVGWFLPWALLGIVVGVVVWAGLDVAGGDDIDPVVTAENSPSPSEEPEFSPSESPTPAEIAEATPTPEKKEPEPEVKPKLIVADVTVQILNATTNRPEADDAMADKLARLGYEIVAVDGASRVYQETNVLWSFEESRKAAERLAERFGWVAKPKPENLSTQVDIHVIVGEDFEG